MIFEKVSKEEYAMEVFGSTDTFDNSKVVTEWMQIKLPERSTKNSAGYDFFMPFDMHVSPGVVYKIPTGIKAKLDDDCVLLICPRSSMGMKHGIRFTNTVGVIDADYYGNEDNEGHIFISLTAETELDLKKGDKIAQGIILRFMKTDDDNASAKRTGGIGSTGR